ncbi:MAG: NUDIX domain-containing protein [Pseudomonadales bacterium]|nr:NUDIX domain-containing protein [Pseudomonadales bacterium]
MLDFTEDNNRFLYRAVAVFIDAERVLLHQFEGDEFWALPGGRVEHGESALDTVVREMKEELSIDIVDAQPVWAADNFFHYLDRNCHEMGVYFKVRASSDSYIYSERQFEGIENETPLTFRWFEIDELDSIRLLPNFLTKSLANLPEGMRYVCHRDDV